MQPQGLSTEQARAALAEHGTNTLPAAPARSFVSRVVALLGELALRLLRSSNLGPRLLGWGA